MADIPVYLTSPNGSTVGADVPSDVPLRDLLSELVTALELTTSGPDGRNVGYKVTIKRISRQINLDETLEAAGTMANDTLIIATDITAGCC